MQPQVSRISIKKLDAFKESNNELDKTKPVTININIAVFDHKKLKENETSFSYSFLLNISGIGRIDVQSEVDVCSDDQDRLISDMIGANNITSPSPTKLQIDNAVFYYLMPLIINISEKMQIPIPIAPLTPMR